MPNHLKTDEKQVLNYIFKENSDLEINEQEKNINTYYAIKHHMPSEIFKAGKLKFNYNKGVSYILASFGQTQLFKIPNNSKSLIEIICPADKDFVNSLDIPDTKKETTIKRYKDTKATVWYIKLTPEEVLDFSSAHWTGFSNVLVEIANKK